LSQQGKRAPGENLGVVGVGVNREYAGHGCFIMPLCRVLEEDYC
jgi:hypothetical protein